MPLDQIADNFQVLLLMGIRVLVILSLTPIVSASHVPFLVRVVLAGVVAFIVKGTLSGTIYGPPETLGGFIVLLASEALIGAVIGFYIQIVFMFLNVITEFFSTQMGLRAVQVLNPLTGDESVVISQFISLIVILVFISSYGLQKVFYYGVSQSFIALNANTIFLGQEKSFLGFLFYGFAKLFEYAFIIALPVFVSLLAVNIGLGLLGKVAPQMNLLVLGLPIQIILGLVLLFLFLPAMIHAIEGVFDNMFHVITTFLKRMSGV